MIKYFALFVLLLQACPLKKDLPLPEALADEKIEIMFYNVENLFDTIDDPKTRDDEFLASSEKNWNEERYNKKLANIYKVLDSLNDSDFPEIIGFCEVENEKVLQDFLAQPEFREKKYEYIHKDSPDERGIDVALVYNSEVFTPLLVESLLVQFPEPFAEDKTRDVLYTKGDLMGSTIHLFVNHWSSRRGGVEASEPKRTNTAQIVKTKIDKILEKDPKAKIFVMGDFNDSPSNKSVCEVLAAQQTFSAGTTEQLFNPFFPLAAKGIGTYNYKGNWNMMDQIIVSKDVMNEKNHFYADWETSAGVLQKDWMMYRDKNHGLKPSRTYGGPRYFGGYSDHLPVYLTLNAPARKR